MNRRIVGPPVVAPVRTLCEGSPHGRFEGNGLKRLIGSPRLRILRSEQGYQRYSQSPHGAANARASGSPCHQGLAYASGREHSLQVIRKGPYWELGSTAVRYVEGSQYAASARGLTCIDLELAALP